MKRPQRAETILRKRNRAGGITLSDFRLKIQSFSNQNIMVLAQKQTHGSTEQNRQPKISPYTYSQFSTTKEANYTMKKRQTLH